MVDDNWLNEKYVELAKMAKQSQNDDDEWEFEEQKAQLEKELTEMELEDQDQDQDKNMISLEKAYKKSRSNKWKSSKEAWDYWTKESTAKELDMEAQRLGRIIIDPEKSKSKMAKPFLLDTDDDILDIEEDRQRQLSQSSKSSKSSESSESSQSSEEANQMERLSWIQIRSDSLENARYNPTAKAFFQRTPNQIEGYDVMWVSAIDNACMDNLIGSFCNYGVEFAHNFGDWLDASPEDGYHTIEDIASYKARQVYEVTGLPCIASRTSFEVEPVMPIPGRDSRGVATRGGGAAGGASRQYLSPRVTSGYKFNDIGDHVDYVVEALKPYSEPTRVTRFRSCFCYYDGDMEIFEYGELDCDLLYANSLRTYIPMSHGLYELSETLQLTFGLEYQKWLKKKVKEALGGDQNRASMRLRDRVLKEGRVLPNDIVDVSSFMDSKVDVNLMDECGRELCSRFEKYKPSKILTVATTGLVVAIPMAKYLQVPVVYARKERSVVMSNAYQAGYSSKTVGKNRELLVSKQHIEDDDRILIVDDFLSAGSSQEALLRIISDSGATPIGVGVLIEKVYDAGRQALSGYDVPVESLVRVASVKNGVLTLFEEEGFSNKIVDEKS